MSKRFKLPERATNVLCAEITKMSKIWLFIFKEFYFTVI